MEKKKITQTKQENLVGKNVQFYGSRITTGNPVSGTVLFEDDEWIDIKLDHEIGGLVNVWYAGETKRFRKSLTEKLKVL